MTEHIVVLLFTDLVNSTAIKNHLSGADITARNRIYRDTILLPHRRRVETSLPDYAGRAVETIGDAFFLVFPNAIQAVQWAVALQLSHISEPIPTPLGPLSVKMGIHMGSPLVDGDHFIGQEVDYAARVAALATGEQILISEAIAASIRSANLTGITLHTHGDFNLKGIGTVPIIELLYANKQPHPIHAAAPTKLSEVSSVIDWRRNCRTLLAAQKRLSTNSLTKRDGLGFELDQIYVPLGLVERKRQAKYGGDVFPEQGSRLYEPEAVEEIVQTFQQQEFFEQILRAKDKCRIAIVGEPGAGKTTLLQKIAAWILNHTEDIPIWISLADLQGKSIEQYLLQDWLKAAVKQVHVTPAMETSLGEAFNQGRVWLLLDAIDEMVIESGNALAKLSNQLSGWIGDARIVLTCRLNVWDAGKNALEAFDTYRNLDFSFGDTKTPDQVGQFIRAWFKEQPEPADRLRAALDQPGRERIKDTVKNPLRLALLCRTWTRWQGELPDTRSGLYQQFIEALYEWKEDRFPTTSSQRNALNQALGRLALRALSQERTRFRLRHRLVCEVLGEPDTELFQLALQLGFLNQVGVTAEPEHPGERVYAFYHPTFQEYFAAQSIADWHEFFNHVAYNPDRGTYRIFELHWREVILLWLGRSDIPDSQKQKLIEALVMFEDNCQDFYHYRAYFLAAVGVAEFSNHPFADEIVRNLVYWSLGNVGFDQRRRSVFLAPDSDNSQAGFQGDQLTGVITTLIQRTASYSLKKGADAALQETDRRRAIASVIDLLQTQQQPKAIRQIAQLLGQLGTGHPEAATALIQVLNAAQDTDTRSQTIENLGKIAIGNAEAIAALSQWLSQTTPEAIRYRAANCLGQIDPDHPKVVSTLIDLFCTGRDQSTRRAAAKSLGKIAPGHPDAIAHLMPLVQNRNAEAACLEATQTLWHLDPGNSLALDTLTYLIHHSQGENIRRLAAQNLGQIDPGNEVAVSALVDLLHHSQQEDMRYKAARILGLVGGTNPEAIAALVEVLSTPEEAVYYYGRSTRYKATQSLGEIGSGNPEVISALKQQLQTAENEPLRRQIAASLGQVEPGSQEALSALIHLIYTSEDN